MKSSIKNHYFSLLLTLSLVIMMVQPTSIIAAQPTVNLGSTSTFAVLAGSAITNTGTTTINGDAGGDVGLYPGTAFTGAANVTISGSVHLADGIAGAAKDALAVAYDDAVGRTPTTTIPTELGGVTLTPGTYVSADGTFQITGTLTLDAQGDPDGVFIFKTASTLITASSSNVNLINSARYCRTFWPVGSSATLGTNSHFVGHIFAMQSITANTGATVQGQLMARNGAVTLDNNTITNGICLDTPIPTPVVKPPVVVAPVVPAPVVPVPVPVVTVPVVPVPVPVVKPPVVIVPAVPVPVVTVPIATAPVITAAVVTPETITPPVAVAPVTQTIDGGQLPKTATPWYNLLFAGMGLSLIGAIGWKQRR